MFGHIPDELAALAVQTGMRLSEYVSLAQGLYGVRGRLTLRGTSMKRLRRLLASAMPEPADSRRSHRDRLSLESVFAAAHGNSSGSKSRVMALNAATGTFREARQLDGAYVGE